MAAKKAPKKEQKLKFRESALEHSSASLSSTTLIQVTSPKAWITLGGLYLALVSGLLWGFFGTISTWVEGQGILLSEKGHIYNAVALEGAEYLVEMSFKPGDAIKKGDLVARLENPNLIKDVKIAKEHLQQYEDNYKEL